MHESAKRVVGVFSSRGQGPIRSLGPEIDRNLHSHDDEAVSTLLSHRVLLLADPLRLSGLVRHVCHAVACRNEAVVEAKLRAMSASLYASRRDLRSSYLDQTSGSPEAPCLPFESRRCFGGGACSSCLIS